MALTKMKLNWGINTLVRLKIDGGSPINLTADSYLAELTEGNHSVELTIVATNKVVNMNIVVPKSIPDRIAEMDLVPQAQVDALNAQITTLTNDNTTLTNQVTTLTNNNTTLTNQVTTLQAQVDAIPSQIETAIENSQGYVNIVTMNGANLTFNITATPTGGSTATKYKLIKTDDTEETITNLGDKTIDVTEYKQIVVQAGNNKVIDKVDLDFNLLTKPNYCLNKDHHIVFNNLLPNTEYQIITQTHNSENYRRIDTTSTASGTIITIKDWENYGSSYMYGDHNWIIGLKSVLDPITNVLVNNPVGGNDYYSFTSEVSNAALYDECYSDGQQTQVGLQIPNCPSYVEFDAYVTNITYSDAAHEVSFSLKHIPHNATKITYRKYDDLYTYNIIRSNQYEPSINIPDTVWVSHGGAGETNQLRIGEATTINDFVNLPLLFSSYKSD